MKVVVSSEITSEIDYKVKPMVIALNNAGYGTSQSCQGHIGIDFHDVGVRTSNGYIRINCVLNRRQKKEVKSILSNFGIKYCRFRGAFSWFNRSYRITAKRKESCLKDGYEEAPERWAKKHGCSIRFRYATDVYFPML